MSQNPNLNLSFEKQKNPEQIKTLSNNIKDIAEINLDFVDLTKDIQV